MEIPPKIGNKSMFETYSLLVQYNVSKVLNLINKRYEFWSEVKCLPLPKGIKTVEELWRCVKLTREMKRRIVWEKYNICFSFTDEMKRRSSELDIFLGGDLKEESTMLEGKRRSYLTEMHMQEAFFSSQIEGATTAINVARRVLRRNLPAKDASEQMIKNNYEVIKYVVKHSQDAITPEILLHLHDLMTFKTTLKPNSIGFRTTKKVNDKNIATNEYAQTAPSHREIPQFIEELCQFFNSIETKEQFVPPIIKAILIHFMVLYVCPFNEANGAIARSLFYWYMLKQEYWLVEYMSISKEIYESKEKYNEAYLRSKIDENDLGYFVTYNINVLHQAFKAFGIYIEKMQAKKLKLRDFLALDGINERQARIIQMLFDSQGAMMNAEELKEKFFASNTEAFAPDIKALVKLELISKVNKKRTNISYVKGVKFDDMIKSMKTIG